MRTFISYKGWLYVATALCLLLSAAQAKTIYVDDDGTADYSTIKAAVKAAKSGDTIVVMPGTYVGREARNITLSDKVLTIRSSDPEDPNVVAETVIDCYVNVEEQLQNIAASVEIDGYRFISMVPNTGAELTLAGLTIVNASEAFSGGAVLCSGAKLTATNCTFADNSVEQWGGAVCCEDSQATFEDCSFVSNVSTKKRGGALYCDNSEVTLTGCDFSSNSGNALRSSNSKVTLIKCLFDQNTGQMGGAIYCYVGLDWTGGSKMVLDHCVFTKNSTQTSGGAIHNNGAQPVISGCRFSENLAIERGGAIYNQQAAPTIISCIFIKNKSTSTGGAVANYIESAPDIINCTFVDNEAVVGGGAITSVRDSHPLVSHCIVWNNTATNGPNLYLAQDTYSRQPSKMTVEYSDLNQGTASVYAPAGTSLTWAQGNITEDPLFTQPARKIYRLSADSPCVDAGDRDYIPADDEIDLDGYRRLYGEKVDIGAFEYQGLSAVYRFWSPVKGRHFYTILGAERDKLINRYPSKWQYEGVAYWAFYGPSEPDLVPVYRFWSPILETHVWTTDEREKERLLNEYAEIYQYEGIVFYAYNPGSQPLSTVPVYRFWSARNSYHFYTMSEEEKEKLITSYSETWTYEGIVWYIHPRAYQLEETTYQFKGGTDDVSYTLTLSAYVDGKEVPIDLPQVHLASDVSRMEMTIGFSELTTTLNSVQIQTQLTDHVATINPQGVPIPFTLSAQATLESATPEGPFLIDPTTGIFADYLEAGQALTAEGAVYRYNGQIAFSDQTVNISATAEATEFALASYGMFEGLDRLPDNIYASMPMTFQWNLPRVQKLLVDTYVRGRRVQVYVTSILVGTDGQWVGQAQH